jgi:hypothetical protein
MYLTEVDNLVVTSYVCIREVLGSYIVRGTGYPDLKSDLFEEKMRKKKFTDDHSVRLIYIMQQHFENYYLFTEYGFNFVRLIHDLKQSETISELLLI